MDDGGLGEMTPQFNQSSLQDFSGLDEFDFDLGTVVGDIDDVPDLLEMPKSMELSLPLLKPHIVPKKTLSVPQLTTLAYSRMTYPIEQMKHAPSTMVLENRTPWCHHLLYEDEMPRVLQGKR
jgi:hypothetical protein